MTDTSNVTDTSASALAPKPETWPQEVWDGLVHTEQWVVAGLHELGYVIGHDIWPVIKATIGLLVSQLGMAMFGAITANIADPALIPAAVGSAILLTTTTTGVADAKIALASAEAAIQADPTVQALLAPPTPAAPAAPVAGT